MSRPDLAKNHEAWNPSSHNTFNNTEPCRELSKGLVERAFNPTCKPENTPSPPDEAKPIITTEVEIGKAENTCGDRVNCYEKAVPTIKVAVKIEHLIDSNKKVGKGKEQSSSSRIEKIGLMTNGSPNNSCDVEN